MTLRRPEVVNLWEWAISGLNLKTVGLIVFAVLASHYALESRVTLVEQQRPEMSRRFDEVTQQLDVQRDQIKEKLDRETYEQDQRRIAEELQAIQESQGRIESALLDSRASK